MYEAKYTTKEEYEDELMKIVEYHPYPVDTLATVCYGRLGAMPNTYIGNSPADVVRQILEMEKEMVHKENRFQGTISYYI